MQSTPILTVLVFQICFISEHLFPYMYDGAPYYWFNKKDTWRLVSGMWYSQFVDNMQFVTVELKRNSMFVLLWVDLYYIPLCALCQVTNMIKINFLSLLSRCVICGPASCQSKQPTLLVSQCWCCSSTYDCAISQISEQHFQSVTPNFDINYSLQ